MSTRNHPSYNQDFYAWIMQNAKLIRQGKFSEVDAENVAEELESMGKGDRRKLINRFAVLLAHLLKWQFQPERRGNSWKYTIKEQRLRVAELLNDSPSLNYELGQQLENAYEMALLIAAKETSLNVDAFPKNLSFSLEQSLNPEFLPD
jgi:hypothetical protein